MGSGEFNLLDEGGRALASGLNSGSLSWQREGERRKPSAVAGRVVGSEVGPIGD